MEGSEVPTLTAQAGAVALNLTRALAIVLFQGEELTFLSQGAMWTILR